MAETWAQVKARRAQAAAASQPESTASSDYEKQIQQLKNQLAAKNQTLTAQKQQLASFQQTSNQALGTVSDLEKKYESDKASLLSSQTENESQFKAAIADLEAQSQAGVTSLGELQSQYDAMVQKFQDREAEYKPLVDQLGANAGQEADAERAKLLARAKQLMVSRGMSETSAMQTSEREIAGASEQARSQMEGQLAQEKIGYLNSLSGDTLALREGAAAMQQGAANQAFQFRQAPLAAKQNYADLLARQNASAAGLEAGYGSLQASSKDLSGQISAQGYAFNKGQDLAMYQAKTANRLGYAGITANELTSGMQRQVNAPTYTRVVTTYPGGVQHGSKVRTS